MNRAVFEELDAVNENSVETILLGDALIVLLASMIIMMIVVCACVCMRVKTVNETNKVIDECDDLDLEIARRLLRLTGESRFSGYRAGQTDEYR
jgi:hypothetical protein